LDDDGSTHLAEYSFLGRNTFVETDYAAQPDVKCTLAETAGRTTRPRVRPHQKKTPTGATTAPRSDVDPIKYGYDG
jgi:hypothetical protein